MHTTILLFLLLAHTHTHTRTHTHTCTRTHARTHAHTHTHTLNRLLAPQQATKVNYTHASEILLHNNENSLSQEEFGKFDLGFPLNQAEKSKLDRQDSLVLDPSTYMVNTNRRKKRRVKFDVAPPPPQTLEAGCQTDESLVPQMRLLLESLPSTPQGTPLLTKLPATPGTPSHVLRA